MLVGRLVVVKRQVGSGKHYMRVEEHGGRYEGIVISKGVNRFKSVKGRKQVRSMEEERGSMRMILHIKY